MRHIGVITCRVGLQLPGQIKLELQNSVDKDPEGLTYKPSECCRVAPFVSSLSWSRHKRTRNHLGCGAVSAGLTQLTTSTC